MRPRAAGLLGLVQVLRSAVAAKQLRQVLREGRARHYRVASRLLRLKLEVALHVRDEAQDGSSLLEARLELGNGGQRLGIEIVEVEDHQRRLVALFAAELLQQVFAGFHKLHAHVQLFGGVADLGYEKEI